MVRYTAFSRDTLGLNVGTAHDEIDTSDVGELGTLPHMMCRGECGVTTRGLLCIYRSDAAEASVHEEQGDKRREEQQLRLMQQF